MRARLDAERLTNERKQHYMKCPKCGADLKERTHGNVTVDECPECHGMWLDAGELDLISHITKAPAGSFMDDFINLFSHRAPRK
jgi:Zn-finger nucleic acid-binding protein